MPQKLALGEKKKVREKRNEKTKQTKETGGILENKSLQVSCSKSGDSLTLGISAYITGLSCPTSNEPYLNLHIVITAHYLQV